MIKLKIFFVVAMLSLIFMLGMFAPDKTIDRFVLPDGCCNNCLSQMKCGSLPEINKPERNKPERNKIVFFPDTCQGQLISAVLRDNKNR